MLWIPSVNGIVWTGFIEIPSPEKVFSYIREYNGKKLLVISNFFKENGYVKFPEIKVKKIVDNNYNEYKNIDLNNLELRPFESYILEIE